MSRTVPSVHGVYSSQEALSKLCLLVDLQVNTFLKNFSENIFCLVPPNTDEGISIAGIFIPFLHHIWNFSLQLNPQQMSTRLLNLSAAGEV